jgi:predicted dehydrogenase
MSTRRDFIKSSAAGITGVSSGLPLLTFVANQAKGAEKIEAQETQIRIGIIGAENSHTRGFGRLFNIKKAFPGMEVVYVWGETEAFAKDAMERGGIPNMVKDPMEMMGKIDALIVDHRHAKYHLEAALPFVEAGIPTFVDKPFCYRVDEGKAFLKMAREKGTPVTSFSSIAQSEETFDIKRQVAEMTGIEQIVRYGPADLESKYGGIFFYGVHIVQPLMFMFGEDIESVRVNRHGSQASANVAFESGLYATLIFTSKTRWRTEIVVDKEIIELKSTVEEPEPARHYQDIAKMFRTGVEPRSHDSILKCVAVLQALEKSVSSGNWETVEV